MRLQGEHMESKLDGIACKEHLSDPSTETGLFAGTGISAEGSSVASNPVEIKSTRNLSIACNHLYQASILLKSDCPPMSDTLLMLTAALLQQIPEKDRAAIEEAQAHIQREESKKSTGAITCL
jgi:hypothetical protein